MKPLTALCAVGALLPSALCAQSGDQLLAFVRSKTSYVVRQDMAKGCQAPVKIADTLSGQNAMGGGAAYDPSTDSVWVSDGLSIRNLSMTGQKLCEFPATVTGKGWVVSGLAFQRANRQLIQLEVATGSAGLSVNVRLYDATACPPKPLPLACKGRTMTGVGVTCAGIAYDNARDLLYYSESSAGYFNGVNTIHVARLAAPCTDINQGSKISVTNCAARYGPPITGMAYADNGQKLYVTLADQTRVLQMLAPTIGQVLDLTTTQNGGKCCPAGVPSTDSYQGLAVRPAHEVKSVGQSCLGAGCQSCTRMQLGLDGAPVIGNSEFSIVVEGAPQGSVGSFYLSAGACSSGVSLPGLCGPIFPVISGPMPLLVGSYGMGGSTGCDGAIKIKTGIPVDPALYGFSLCTQWLMVCPTARDAGLTNAVEFKVGG